LTDKSFTFLLRNNPEQLFITMPCYDETLVGDNQFTYHNVIEERYYSLNSTAFPTTNTPRAASSNKMATDNYKAVIDSGTFVIIGPKTLVEP
jgi:Eukaryotic aspartyl protease